MVGYAGGELIAFLVILFLVGVNALFVAAEYATVGVGRTRARSLVREGLPGGAALAKLTSDPVRLDRAITACQVGISASSLSLGAYSQIILAPALAPWLAGWGFWGEITSQSLAVAVVLAATSSFQIVFGEQLPKSIVVRNPSPWALRMAPALWLSTWVLTPLIAFLGGSARVLLRLAGLPSRPGTRPHSSAEIGWIVTQSAHSGVLHPEQSERLRNAIQFATRTARDVMVPRVQVKALPVTASLDEIRAYITATGHSRIPVYGDDLDDVQGVLHAKELLLRAGGPGPSPSVREMMRPLPMVPWSMRALPLLERMKVEHAGLAVVLDEHGGTAGIVSLEDLVEEVLGEVEDEFDVAAPDTGQLPDGRLRLRGEETLDWVNRRHGLQLTSEEAHTMGGLVMECLSRVARPGDVVHQDNVRLEVERVSGRRVVTVLVTPVGNGHRDSGRNTP
ncbi:MAG: hemolysin family protein [Acidobacteria bacterium]|nr:hemolysin family protein [Acidobacteriota bacterium]